MQIFRESFSSVRSPEERFCNVKNFKRNSESEALTRTVDRPSSSASSRIQYCVLVFSCSLTRRANQTRRGYRWPTSEPISYSSKRLHSVDYPHPVGRHERHYHHSPPPSPLPPLPTTTQQQPRQHQQSAQLHSTIHSIVCSRSIALYLLERCFFVRIRRYRVGSYLSSSLLSEHIIHIMKILNPKLG